MVVFQEESPPLPNPLDHPIHILFSHCWCGGIQRLFQITAPLPIKEFCGEILVLEKEFAQAELELQAINGKRVLIKFRQPALYEYHSA